MTGDPLEFLAPIGFDWVLQKTEASIIFDDELGDTDYPAALAKRHREASAIVRDWLCAERAEDYGPTKKGCRIGDRLHISWPDRVPGFVTWSGQQSLTKIVRKWQDAVRKCDDLYTLIFADTSVTGLDGRAATTALADGFSRYAVGLETILRPGLELLAIVALESLPLVSFPRRHSHSRECGFIHDGRVYRLTVEHRQEGYWRWTTVRDSAAVEGYAIAEKP